MAGISSIGGSAGLATARLQAEIQTRVLKLSQDALELQGDLALQLIQSAVADPEVGNSLDARV